MFAAIAIGSGLLALLSMRAWAAGIERARPDPGAPMTVFVAARDLTRGAQLVESSLEVSSVPSAFAPPGAVADADDAIDRTLLADLAAGEVVTESRLGARGGGPVAALIPPGLRAFAVSVPLPATTVRAGDRVDVLATFGGGRPHTETVAEAVEILSVLRPDRGQATTGDETTIVLLAAHELVEQLAYAQAFADLGVALTGSEPDLAGSVPPAAISPTTAPAPA